MTLTEAERKAAQRIRNQAKDRTPEEKAALSKKKQGTQQNLQAK
jgi:hypothetical protein